MITKTFTSEQKSNIASFYDENKSVIEESITQDQEKELISNNLEYIPLSEKVASKLRNEIIGNLLPEGTKIVESEISSTLGVSRTVVREAIMKLVQEGLIVKEHNRYSKVSSYTKKDIVEIYDMRAGLELTAARICVGKTNIAEKLHDKEKLMLRLSGEKEIDRLAYVYADMDFHNCIIQSSGNSRLIDAWSKTSGPCLVLLYRYALSCSKQSPLGKLTYDHSNIIRSFASKDYNLVYNNLMEHIDTMKNILLNKL